MNKDNLELSQKKTEDENSSSYFNDSENSLEESIKEEIKLNDDVIISSSDLSDFKSENEINDDINRIIEKKSNYAKVI
jgi:hypothetical protein